VVAPTRAQYECEGAGNDRECNHRKDAAESHWASPSGWGLVLPAPQQAVSIVALDYTVLWRITGETLRSRAARYGGQAPAPPIYLWSWASQPSLLGGGLDGGARSQPLGLVNALQAHKTPPLYIRGDGEAVPKVSAKALQLSRQIVSGKIIGYSVSHSFKERDP